MKNILCIIVVLFCLSSCIKDRNEVQEYIYPETQCSDPWAAELEGFDDQSVMDAAEDWLNQQDINIKSIDRSYNSEMEMVCNACVCGSGHSLQISAKKKFEDELIELGFILQ